VGEPHLWIHEALAGENVPAIARRLGVSLDLVYGWGTGKSLPNLSHLARAPRRFSLRVLASLGDHLLADQVAHQDLDEALRLLYLAFGALLADLSRKPLDERTPKEAREIADRAAEIEQQQAAILRRLATEQARTVEAPQEGR
jgi:hypothetical protein